MVRLQGCLEILPIKFKRFFFIVRKAILLVNHQFYHKSTVKKHNHEKYVLVNQLILIRFLSDCDIGNSKKHFHLKKKTRTIFNFSSCKMPTANTEARVQNLNQGD